MLSRNTFKHSLSWKWIPNLVHVNKMNLLEFVQILAILNNHHSAFSLEKKKCPAQKTVSSQQIMQHKRNIRINENINNLTRASCDKSRIKKPELYRKRGYAWSYWAYITAQAGEKTLPPIARKYSVPWYDEDPAVSSMAVSLAHITTCYTMQAIMIKYRKDR